MKFTVNIEKRYTYILLGVLSILFAGVLVVSLATSIDTSKGYHESTQVNVNIPGVGEKTLQESIEAGDLAGGSGIIPSGAVMPFNLATGGDQPHENRQPYLALLYCQKN